MRIHNGLIGTRIMRTITASTKTHFSKPEFELFLNMSCWRGVMSGWQLISKDADILSQSEYTYAINLKNKNVKILILSSIDTSNDLSPNPASIDFVRLIYSLVSQEKTVYAAIPKVYTGDSILDDIEKSVLEASYNSYSLFHKYQWGEFRDAIISKLHTQNNESQTKESLVLAPTYVDS